MNNSLLIKKFLDEKKSIDSSNDTSVYYKTQLEIAKICLIIVGKSIKTSKHKKRITLFVIIPKIIYITQIKQISDGKYIC